MDGPPVIVPVSFRLPLMWCFLLADSDMPNLVAEWSRPPNFLLVDYYNEPSGTVFEVAATMNNVTYNRQCCGLPTQSFAPALKVMPVAAAAIFVVVVFAVFL